MKLHGYTEAAKVDEKINALLKRHPITKENALEYWKFARTIETSCQLISEIAKEKLLRDEK